MKERRQGKRIPKTRYSLLVENGNYDYLSALAREYRVSIAKMVNAILRSKPKPDDFVLR